MKYIFPCFVIAFVGANLIVKHFGAQGLWISSFLLIPFDFIVRCIIHEKYSGLRLFVTLLTLTLIAALITVIINRDAINIAWGSIAGFAAAQAGAGTFYQIFKRRKSYLFKVNLSDLVAICCDSLLFQLVAFGSFLPTILLGQILVKFSGGLLWYYILFYKLRLHEKILNKNKTKEFYEGRTNRSGNIL